MPRELDDNPSTGSRRPRRLPCEMAVKASLTNGASKIDTLLIRPFGDAMADQLQSPAGENR